MNSDIYALLVYRLTVLLCGFGSVVMGYRLFRLGVFEKAGELKANWGGNAVLLKAAAPGTFFALFGSAVIAFAIWKGFTVETVQPAAGAQTNAAVRTIGSAGSTEFQQALQAAAAGQVLTDEQKQALAAGLAPLQKRTIQAK
jgi:hypothetical protein